MLGGKNKNGYTVVEVLMFLAISGLMFIVAANAVSGKLAKAQFKQGINASNGTIRQIISDVGNGYFPGANNVDCHAAATGAPQIIAGNTTQGENIGCAFIGKIIEFNPAGDPTEYNTYSIAGRQFKAQSGVSTNGVDISSGTPGTLQEASPREFHDVSDLGQKLEWGSEFTGFRTKTGNVITPYSRVALALVKSFQATSNGSLATASQSTDIYVIPPASYSQGNPDTIVSYIASHQPVSNLNAWVCILGANGQYGSINLGSQYGQKLTTRVLVGSTNPASVRCQ